MCEIVKLMISSAQNAEDLCGYQYKMQFIRIGLVSYPGNNFT